MVALSLNRTKDMMSVPSPLWGEGQGEGYWFKAVVNKNTGQSNRIGITDIV
jgi:hypothetical protein